MYACRRLLQALEARMLAMLDLVGIKYLVERWSVGPHTHSFTITTSGEAGKRDQGQNEGQFR